MPAPVARLPRRATLALPLILPLAAALPGRARAALPPITDAIGRQVRLSAPAGRIVLGFNYEEFTAIAGPAGWDRVVGFGRALWAGWRPASFSRYRAVIPRLDTLADVGNTDDNSFSLERVLSLRPDLVILPAWSYGVLGEQVAQLEALGIPVMVIDYNAQEPARHAASTIALGIVAGSEERGRALAAMYLDRVADIGRRIAGAPHRPRVYLELSQGGAGVVGNTYWQGMWGRIFDMVGADNIAAGRIPKAWGPLNPEYVLTADPEAIFIGGSSWVGRPNAVPTGFDADIATTRARLAPYARRQGWAELTAIRTGELHAIEHGLCRALYDYTAMQYIAKAIFPDRFTDIDPVEELRRYHAQYLPVRFEGTWMARLAPVGA
ncbi:ABC transporter substrate-binding protein [Rhodovastum atsumiense]|uniref:ABC transporter substrate-binding protein n=1 Tax=Rhodovastum atsumiense TaxID=504468 RepID=A0A5M6IV67_9PROT|nr:ABC transporter substrate-binding protein [Rhodovastum atsumiense]KAA5611295.1 ABC transporter substrate-binding protein [Rhodovastum atsumiense]CAH2601762.1 ABC transporter substrate-binding protein [Rhodovastum atsumiense]